MVFKLNPLGMLRSLYNPDPEKAAHPENRKKILRCQPDYILDIEIMTDVKFSRFHQFSVMHLSDLTVSFLSLTMC